MARMPFCTKSAVIHLVNVHAFCPEGTSEISRWRKPPERAPTRNLPRQGLRKTSPQITFVVFHTSSLEKLDVFFLKGPSPKMLLLSDNVLPHVRAMRRADRKSAVAFLPLKGTQSHLVMYPAGRNALHLAHHLGKTMGGAQTHEDMDMVGHSTDRLGNSTQVMNGATEKTMQTLPPSRSNQWSAVLGRKNHVIVQREVRGRHGARRFQRPCRGALFFSMGSGGWRHRLLLLAKLVHGPEGQWKLAGGASHRTQPPMTNRPGRGGSTASFPAPLPGRVRSFRDSGGWRHRLISGRPPGEEKPPPILRDSITSRCPSGTQVGDDEMTFRFGLIQTRFPLKRYMAFVRKKRRERGGGDGFDLH